MVISDETLEVIKKGSTSVFGSEREFREKVVSRLLESLGWNSIGDIQYETSIKAGTVVLRVDYVVGSDSQFALETKKPGVNISPGSSAWNQIVSYLRLDPTLLFGVLYNGRELHILDSHGQEPLVSWSHGKSTDMFDLLSKEYFPAVLKHYANSIISGTISSENFSDITSPLIAEIDRNNQQIEEAVAKAKYLKRRMHGYLLLILLDFIFTLIILGGTMAASGSTLPLVVIIIVSALCFYGFLIMSLYYSVKLKLVKRRFNLNKI